MTANEYFAQFPDKRFEVSKPAKPKWANQAMVSVRIQFQTVMPAKARSDEYDLLVRRFEEYMGHHCPIQCGNRIGK